MKCVIILIIYILINKKIMRKTATVLFHARQQAHFWHLDTKSFAEHKALDDFYTGLFNRVF